MTDYTHDGKKSWWDGSYRSLCGMTLPAQQVEVPFFVSVTCPTCKAIKKGK